MSAWWGAITHEFMLEPHELALLELAAHTHDRWAQAKATIDREGLTLPTEHGGRKPHPATKVEADARTSFARLVRELGLSTPS